MNGICIGKEKPFSPSDLRKLVAGPVLSVPSIRKLFALYDFEFRMTIGYPLHDFVGPVGRVVIKYDDLKVGIAGFHERGNTPFDVLFFIPGRDKDRNEGQRFFGFQLVLAAQSSEILNQVDKDEQQKKKNHYLNEIHVLYQLDPCLILIQGSSRLPLHPIHKRKKYRRYNLSKDFLESFKID